MSSRFDRVACPDASGRPVGPHCRIREQRCEKHEQINDRKGEQAARRSRPDSALPQRFAHHEDAVAQLRKALSFHEGIGTERKAARLRYLRNRWVDKLRSNPRINIHTSLDPAQSCAIGTVQITTVPTAKAVPQLWDKWRIIATPIVHALPCDFFFVQSPVLQ